jgi:hypothetical protein
MIQRGINLDAMMHTYSYRVTVIDDFPPLAFKIGTGETKVDREWLKKKKDYFEKLWGKSGPKILAKIEDFSGDTFTNTSKEEGIAVTLHKKKNENRSGSLKADNPLEISIFLAKNDNINSMKEQLVSMLTRSFIQQKYQFHFRIHEQTLFEDILADEFVASMISFMVLGKKPGRANCEKALNEAIEETVYRMSQKTARAQLLTLLCNFSQEYTAQIKGRKTDVLEKREELITQLLKFLPETLTESESPEKSPKLQKQKLKTLD